MTPVIFLHRVAVAAHAGLGIAIAVREPRVIALMLIVPLLVPLWGIAKARAYTCAWASMLIVFYVGGYLAAGWSRPDLRTSAFLVAGVAALDFIALVMFVRLKGREAAMARARAARIEASAGAAH